MPVENLEWMNIDQTPDNPFGKSTDYEAFLDYLGGLNRDLTPEMAQSPIRVNVSELNNHPDYKAAAIGALQQWAATTPLQFEIIDDRPFDSDLDYLEVVSPELGEEDDGSAYSANRYVSVGQRFHDTEPNSSEPGGYLFNTFVHEFGHEWGLNHPGVYNYGGPGGDQINFLNGATWIYDQQRYSIMSYFDGIDVGGTTRWTSTTPSVGDIEAVIRHYFATVDGNGDRTYQDIQLNTGNDRYGFGSNKLGYELTADGPGYNIGFVIHDTGGTDTVDFSGSTAGTLLDLRAGRWSSVNGHEYNVTIFDGHNADATEYYIEKGIGSAFADIIIGNDGDNALVGGDGADKIAGLGGNDKINGGNQTDVIYGGTGDDYLIGGLDTLDSRDRNNTLPPVTGPESKDGNDRLYGEEGDDTIDAGAGDDILDGGDGNDILRGMAGIDVFKGGAGVDTVDFSRESPFQLLVNLELNIASGGTASGDTFYSIENLIGSDDRIDRFIGTDDANYFRGLGGGDVFNGGDGNDVLDGARDGDVLYGDGGNDRIIGGAGQDYIHGGAGRDTADYTTGSDSKAISGVTVNLATGVASGGDAEGNTTKGVQGDILVSIENLTGSKFADVLTGDDGVNIIRGAGGNDSLSGGGGKDLLDGGDGMDMVAFYDSTVGVTADLTQPGEDTLVSIEGFAGSAFNDKLTGDAGANALVGQGGDDTLVGGDGDDVLDGDFTPIPPTGIGMGSGYATLDGKAKNNSLATAYDITNNFTAAVDPDIFDSDTVPHTTVNATGNGQSGFYKLTLEKGATLSVDIDHIADPDVHDSWILLIRDNGAGGVLVANNDDNGGDPGSVSGRDSALTYTVTQAGTYYIQVGAWIDGASPSGFSPTVPVGSTYEVNVSVAPADVGMPNVGSAGDDTLFGGDGNDTLLGRAGADVLNGGNGADTASYAGSLAAVVASLINPAINTGDADGDSCISIEHLTGSSFDDTLHGNDGRNILMGGAGDDALKGNGGNDTLAGGLGQDTLHGGAGLDAFLFDTVPVEPANVDRILDFNAADDAIWLDNAAYTVLTALGGLAAAAFKDTADGAKDASDRIIYNSANGNLYYDADGSGDAFGNIKIASLTGTPGLTAADFIVV